MTDGLLQATLGLALVLGVIVAFAWVARRLAPGTVRGTGVPLTIIASQAVGQRERVVVVEVADQWLVLGVAPGRVCRAVDAAQGHVPHGFALARNAVRRGAVARARPPSVTLLLAAHGDRSIVALAARARAARGGRRDRDRGARGVRAEQRPSAVLEPPGAGRRPELLAARRDAAPDLGVDVPAGGAAADDRRSRGSSSCCRCCATRWGRRPRRRTR